MFDLIHEFSVLGTACFMMALATIWYSPMLFGKTWMQELSITDEMIEKAQPDMWKHMILTFVSYVVMLGLIAIAIVYVPLLGFTSLQFSLALALFVAAAAVAPALFEGRSVAYYGIRVGFYAVFIVAGTFILENWPW